MLWSCSYLLGSIVSATFTCFTLSLLLPFRLLFPSRGAVQASVTLYQGTVWHERRRPVHHSFKYTVRCALYDLDHEAQPPSDHLSADEARCFAETSGSVFLLTIPPSVGYEQNPLSLYYCYDFEGSARSLKRCIAEDMLGNWRIRTSVPEDNLFVAFSVQHPKLGDYFSASLTAKRMTSSAIDHALFFWLMPHKVAFWIYWHVWIRRVNLIGLVGIPVLISVSWKRVSKKCH